MGVVGPGERRAKKNQEARTPAPKTAPRFCGGSCGLTCTAIFNDPFNCGDCGVECGPNEVCTDGACSPVSCDGVTPVNRCGEPLVGGCDGDEFCACFGTTEGEPFCHRAFQREFQACGSSGECPSGYGCAINTCPGNEMGATGVCLRPCAACIDSGSECITNDECCSGRCSGGTCEPLPCETLC